MQKLSEVLGGGGAKEESLRREPGLGYAEVAKEREDPAEIRERERLFQVVMIVPVAACEIQGAKVVVTQTMLAGSDREALRMAGVTVGRVT